MSVNCVSCGMEMKAESDFALGDSSKNYCSHCTNEDGTMWSYEDAKIGMTNFLVSSQNVKAEDAELAAIQYLSEQPAWKN